MRIVTWNVNSIGARLPRLLPWLAENEPDVVALQETKCADSAFPYADLRALGYEAVHSGDGRWNGVALLSRLGIEAPERMCALIAAALVPRNAQPVRARAWCRAACVKEAEQLLSS